MALVELQVRNFAVIASGRISPGPAFTALTGETGSGKSLFLTALRLALGGKFDPAFLREGAEGSTLTAVFDQVPAPLAARLTELGIAEDEYLTLTRELTRTGRSQCRINATLVSLPRLQEVAASLADITSQGESVRLLRPSYQAGLLDTFIGTPLQEPQANLARLVGAWRGAEATLLAATDQLSSSGAARLDAEETVERLSPLDLRIGEEAELRLLAGRLQASDSIRHAAAALQLALDGDDTGAADQLARGLAEAAPARHHDPALGDLVEQATGLVDRLRELARVAAHIQTDVEEETGRIDVVEERLSLLARLIRRYGSEAAALEALDTAHQLLTATASPPDLATLQAKLEVARNQAGRAAEAVSLIRRAAADRLATLISNRLQALGMPLARFEIEVTQALDPAGVPHSGRLVTCTPSGADQVTFLLAPNGGDRTLPLGGGISGGELSRLALALRAEVASGEDCPTLILDEVDTGIGGKTALLMGEVLAQIGKSTQVICITHRAEIAGRADTHLRVEKTTTSGMPTATANPVTGEARLAEMSRLLSGISTTAARARAAELLSPIS